MRADTTPSRPLEDPAAPQAKGWFAAIPESARWALGAAVMAALPWLTLNDYQHYLLNIMMINIILAVGLNIVKGFCGQVTVGHIALAAIGAYSSAVLTVNFGFSFWTSLPLEFEGKPLKSLSQGDVDFDAVPLTDEQAAEEEPEDAASAIDEAVVLAAVKSALEGRVSDVRSSKRLTESPACLIAGQSGPDRRLERILAHAQPLPASLPVLELNMKHHLVRAISDARAAGTDAIVTDLASLLLEEGQILDGEIPADPAAFAQRINRLIARGLS